MRSLLLIFVALIIVGSISTIAHCQDAPPDIPLFSTVAGGPDQINLANLSIFYNVRVFSRAGRGIPFSYSTGFNNALWGPLGTDPGWEPIIRPAGTVIGGVFSAGPTEQDCDASNGEKVIQFTFSISAYQDIQGVTHPFDLRLVTPASSIAGCPSQTTATGFANDGSGISLTVSASDSVITSAVVTLPDGSVINPPIIANASPTGLPPTETSAGPYTWTDSNGNQISYTLTSGAAIASVTDNLGTAVVTGSGPNPTVVSFTSPSGGTSSTTDSFKAYTVASAWGCSNITEYAATNRNLLDRITLPDGTFYQFSYENSSVSGAKTARVSSVTLPTGGTISYTYGGGTNGINCNDGQPMILKRITPDGTWTYQRSSIQLGTGFPAPVLSSVTTVTDPAGNQTVYHFAGNYETERQVYSGTATGTPLENIIVCYNAKLTSPSTCPEGEFEGIQSFSEIVVYRSLNGGPFSIVDTKLNEQLGLVTEQDKYDFGASTPTSIKSVTYASLGNGIVNRPSVIKTTSGSGNFISETAYTYDQDLSSLKASGASQLVAPSCSSPPCPRGSVTTIQKYVTATTFLTQTFTHYDTGQVYQATDVNGVVTTYTYGDCGNSMLTGTSVPVGSVTLTTSQAWNCTGAVVASTTDANGQPTKTAYSDPFYWRPASVTDPTGASTNFCYGIMSSGSCTANATQIESVLSFNSGNSAVDTLDTLDSLGRPILSQTRQSPSSTSFDTTSASYDSLGRPSNATMPCVANATTACPATPATTTTYDAASRPLVVTDGGGGTTTYSYNQNDVLVTVGPAPPGENTKSRQLQYDGLGRLTSVCEITTASGSGTCAQTNAQTGYWTTYTYSALSNGQGTSFSVTQNAQGSTAQTRSFAYDGLSRLTSETNPEWNNATSKYTYDTADSTCASFSSPGDLVETKDPAGNVVCTQFDALHRQTSETYASGPNAGNSASKFFVYDTTSSAFTCSNGSNVLGRLGEAYTGSSSSKVTDAGFCYSPRGEVTDTYETTPKFTSPTHIGATYFPNGGLDTLIHFGHDTWTYTLDGEGRTNNVSIDGKSPAVLTSTTYNPAQQVTNLALGSGDSDAFTFFPTTGKLKTYTYNVGSSAVSGTVTWNTNGTLQKVVNTDPFHTANSQTCNYGYDDLARVASVNCGASVWVQNFTYDPFGNVTKNVPSGDTGIAWNPGYNQSTNQYTLSGTTYDADGNLTNDSANTYQWDATGMPTTIDSTTYIYDALGRLAESDTSSSSTQYIYSPTGDRYGMSSGGTVNTFVPLPGGLQAVFSGSSLLNYRHPDFVGSSRLNTTFSQTVYFDTSYGPFGESYNSFGTTDLFYAGHDQGAHSGLYDTPYRQYNPTQGRWMRPDPAGLGAADSTNPQSWNRYAYVLNNPLSAIDPLGLNCVWDDGSSEADDDPKYGNTSSGQANCSKDGGQWIDSVTGDWNPNPNPGLANEVANLQAAFENPVAAFQAQGVAGPDDFGGGGGGWVGMGQPSSGSFITYLRRTLGRRAPGETWSRCMAANASNYSIGGAAELSVNVATGTNSNISGTTSFITGNGITGLLFEGPGAGDFVSTAGYGAGSSLTYGRRTSDVMSLNLAGNGGLPKALGSSGAQGFFGSAGRLLNLGLDEAEKIAADAGLAGAEAINCSIPE